MRPTSTEVLPADLRAQAEAFFDADLSTVKVRIGEEPLRMGAAAFASGDTVHLTPRTAGLPRLLLDEVLGHELTHVLQQREGRVTPRRWIGDVAVNEDAELEREAAALGQHFARRSGERRVRPRGEARRAPQVAQPLVTVARAAVPRINALSERARLVLGFIRDGREWFSWAASAPSVKYDFPEESRMLESIQSGLHASPFLRMPRIGLLVSPAKLMTAQPGDLEVLAAAERGDASAVVAEQTGNILAAHHLLTDADLSVASAFLREVGVAQDPLFQALSLEDRIALFDLLHAAESAAATVALAVEAAGFAVGQAETPREFADFYPAYLVLATRLGMLDAAPEVRLAAVQKAVEALRGCLYGALDCPQIGGLAAPAQVARAVRSWIARGKQVAFARPSSGIRQILQHTRFEQQTGEAARVVVASYLREAQAFLAGHEPKGGRLGQDGVTCVLPVDSETRQGELELGHGGQITLRSFRLKAAPPLPSGRALTASVQARY